jgi:transcriptional regulator with GAF, ATPase, and Fis domain
VRELGAGASGRVLLVQERSGGLAQRALKIVQPEAEEAVRCEFTLLTRIAHPHLARVHELVRVDESELGARLPRAALGLVSDFAAGVPADRAARELSLSRPRLLLFAVRVLDRTARALAAVHAHGFVHGDVKPDNVIVTPDAAELRLIDLGFARPPGFVAQPSGTPHFMAPELWRGEVSPASDVFALGVLVRELLSPAQGVFDGPRSVAEHLARALQPLAALPAWVPAPLEALLSRMCAPDRTQRLGSARAVLEALADVAASLEAPLARELVGPAAAARSAAERASAVTALPLFGQSEALAKLGVALRKRELCAVVGPLGSGRSRVVRDAVFALQLERAGRGAPVPSYRVLTRLPQALDDGPQLLHVLRADAVDLNEAHALLLAARVVGQECLIVLERTLPLTAADVTAVAVERLSSAAVQELLQSALPEQPIKASLVRDATAASGGMAARLCQLLGAGLLAGADMSLSAGLRAHALRAGADDAHIPEQAWPLVQTLCVAGGSLPQNAVLVCVPNEALAAGAHLACALGLCSRSSDGRLALRPDVQASVWKQLSPERRSELARAIPAGQLGPRARAFLACAQADSARVVAEFANAAQLELQNGDPAAAADLTTEAEQLLGRLPEPLALLRAEALRALGDYRQALATLAAVSGVPAQLARAEILRLLGDASAAREAAEAILTQHRHDRDDKEDRQARTGRPAASALLARLALDSGEHDLCREHALTALASDEDPAARRASEVLALLELGLGQLLPARAAAEVGLGWARRRGERAAEARLLAVVGAIDRADGELRSAARSFARACELADAQGEYHAAASFLINLGTAQLDAGELGPALRSLRQGARRLARLGRQRDLARALTNLVLAAQLTGDFERALSLGELAEQTARDANDVCALAFALLSSAEVMAEQGQLVAARERLRTLPSLAALAPVDRASALARAASLHAGLGDAVHAALQLEAAEALLPSAGAADVECALARAALCRLQGDPIAAAGHAERALASANLRGEFAVQVLALLAAGAAAEALGDLALSRNRFAQLRTLLDSAALTLSAVERALLRRVKAYRAALSALPMAQPRVEVDQRFRQLTLIVKRLTAETRLQRLYELILDGAIELSGAESGVLLRKDAQGGVRVRAARSEGGSSVAGAQLSQSIVARVLATGQPLSTVDAAEDARLSAATSVHALCLRSVLALPIRVHDDVVGLIYLEDRLRPFAFGEAEVALLADFSDLSAMTISGLERLRRERRAVRRLSLAQARLARQVEVQALEISSWKSAKQGAGEHPGIVAESSAMREVLALSLRVARSDVPVLIRGESGTGKELVAKAIHDASSRREQPFISENCGAIPEALLESALFGHVKGAFTGADRRRIGLFEAANGGTLLLDEIGEMNPNMQARLLRVLQDGEVRPLGGERSVRVDVRVLAATHRDLDAMVADGSFREDLFYRLAVVSVAIPPLRERSDDILPLVRYFIHKHAPDRSPRVDRRALDRLLSQPWPGNVRQLENEVRRALVLGGDVLREEHFGVARAREAGNAPAELHLRSQIDDLERRLIRRALDIAKGNQTRAAELLGVSRFGLQKMLKRLGLLA